MENVFILRNCSDNQSGRCGYKNFLLKDGIFKGKMNIIKFFVIFFKVDDLC